MKPETVTFTKVVEIADCDGKPIWEGAVLQHIKEQDRGVVIRISRVGDRACSILDQVGDLVIQTSRGSYRHTNNYSQWKHIPHDEQTYEERFVSWCSRRYNHQDTLRQCSEDEGLAIDGILALLPEDAVDWDFGPFPDKFPIALEYLKRHLEKLANERRH